MLPNLILKPIHVVLSHQIPSGLEVNRQPTQTHLLHLRRQPRGAENLDDSIVRSQWLQTLSHLPSESPKLFLGQT